MTAAQMIELLRSIPAGDARASFYQLAQQVYAARLKNGTRLTDVIDFSAWLRELGEECARTEGQLLPERSTGLKVTPRLEMKQELYQLERVCPGCGHVHEGDYECGTDMGGAGKCGCRMEVRV
jgi:hypothetical protein